MAGRWRVWLPGRRAVPPASPQSDPFTAPANPATEADALSRLLDEIQAVALAVYDQHGLPTRLGHYVRDPVDGEWRLIAEQLSPTRRFELMLEHPAEQGWRFARLEDLGARHRDHPEVEVASELLNAVSRLRRNRGSASADDLAEAIRLGQIWRTLTAPRTVEPEIAAETVAPPHTPLTLQPPERPKRRRRR
jgi:hypothetical protein